MTELGKNCRGSCHFFYDTFTQKLLWCEHSDLTQKQPSQKDLSVKRSANQPNLGKCQAISFKHLDEGNRLRWGGFPLNLGRDRWPCMMRQD